MYAGSGGGIVQGGAGEEREQQQVSTDDGQGQHQHVAGRVLARDGRGGQQLEVDGQIENSFTWRLRHPDDNMSPKWKKTRRRKTRDNLKQATLNFMKYPENKKQISPSDEGLVVPSGGSLGIIKCERGTKRGMGDQVEGPDCKKRRDDTD